MGLRISDQQHRFLVGLLEILRNEIRLWPPISFAEFEGIEAKDDINSRLLANGVCSIGDRFFYFGGSDPPNTIILFGPDNVADGIKRLNEISPKLFEAVKMFSPPDSVSELEAPKEDWRWGVLAAKLVAMATERAREIEPESLVLP